MSESTLAALVMMIFFLPVPILGGESQPLVCDQPVTATIDPASESDFFAFDVGEGEIVTIGVIEDQAAPIEFEAEWRLLDGGGNPASDCDFFTIADQRDCGPLPEVGNTYQVQVQDFFNDDVGAYRVHLQRLTATAACEQIPLRCGVPLTTAIEEIADNDLVSFCVTDQTVLSIAVVPDPSAPFGFETEWRLLDGSGNPATDCDFFTIADQRDCGPLPESGNPYQIQAQEFLNDEAGAYAVSAEVLSGSCFLDCLPGFIFEDGFESGDTTAWSSSVGG